ncbi:MAG: hypothetical protein E6I39_01415 [Chloroflexi bacterium]|nr:MAG: hypothetical protein E6I98_03730 [Chloroflexota bacterium]TMF02170.1 MAG: hypothetical protein E6I39_01415 [Chloroflexota bacterium]
MVSRPPLQLRNAPVGSRCVSPRVVMEILGHSRISLTMNTYAHVLPEMARDAANRMSDLIRSENDDR